MALKIHVHESLESTSGDEYPSQHTCVRCGGVDDEPLMSRIDGKWVCDDCADDYRKEIGHSKHVHNKAVGYESKLESVDKRSLKNRLYKALRPINGKYYSDENWQAIQDFKQIVNGVIEEPLRLDVFAFDGGYRTSKDGYTHWKEYDFEIYDSSTNKHVVDGKITCSAAGTVEDPFSRYDVTITMY